MRFLTSLLFSFFICFTTVTAQHVSFQSLTVDDGLSQNSVLAITQDSRGFIWFGTERGLNRYDTRTFKTYNVNKQDKNGISSGYIRALLSDRKGNLWVGTSNGLDLYNPKTDDFTHILFKNGRDSIYNSLVNDIYQDRQGNIWVCNWNGLGLISKKAPYRCVRVAMPDSLNGPFKAVYQDHNGAYWIGSSDGLIKMERSGDGYVFKIYRSEKGKPNTISDNNVTAFTEDAQHNLWIGTLHGGVNILKISTGTFTQFSHYNSINDPLNNNIRILRQDGAGKIWVGTQWGISIIDPQTRKLVSYRHDPEDKNSLSQNSVYSIFIDKSNSVWIGTYFGGVNMASAYNTAFQTDRYHAVINNNVVSAITEDQKHNLWIGTEGAGLYNYSRASDLVNSYQNSLHDPASLGANLIKKVYCDRSQNIWVGTHGGGLNVLAAGGKRFTRYLYKDNDKVTLTSEVLSIFEDSRNNFWVGTGTGLLLFKRSNTELQPVKIPLLDKIKWKAIHALLEDHQHNLWVGTDNGLFELDPERQTIRGFTTADGLSANYVNCIHEDGDKRLWVGMYYAGLASFNAPAGRFECYTEKNGLVNNNVLGILDDEHDNLWISTGNGLSRFNIKSTAFKNYSRRDGLGGNTFNINSCYKTAAGEMLFGGLYGITSFFPSQIIDNNIPPPVMITELKLNDQPVGINQADKILKQDISLTKSLIFSHSQNVFTINFAALNYIKPEKNKYAYKLNGFDKEWVYTDIPTVNYTNLPSGSYTFYAKGSNNDHVWGKATVLEIKVLPPFWQTGWAYVLYVLLAGGIVFFIARFFILQSLLKRDKELTQLKLSFFTNISHEIRTHLSLIFGPLEKLLINNLHDESQKNQLQIIKKNSNSLLHLVNELMDFRKAETGNLKLHIGQHDLVAFLHEIQSSFFDSFLSRNISSGFTCQAEGILLYFDKEQLEKVFFNLIFNACKYTDDHGFIDITVDEQTDLVKISITDNGHGIAPHNLKNLFKNYFQENDHGKQNTGYGIGLALSKSIVDLHKGVISVESDLSANGNRTVFSVTLKKGCSHFQEKYIGNGGFNNSTPVRKEPFAAVFPDSQNAVEPLNNIVSRTFENTILVIEDNADVCALICEQLQGAYNIIACKNGFEGLQSAVEKIPDVIISDVMMPEMDGITLCSKLKADERTCHIPFILLTARSTTDNQVEGFDSGADVYITKPFSMQALALQVNNLLRLRTKLHERFSAQLRLPGTLTEVDAENKPKTIKSTAGSADAMDDPFMRKMIRLIHDNIDSDDLNVPFLSSEMGMSQPVLYKKLYALSGTTVNELIKNIRLQKAMELLQENDRSVFEVAYMVGFNDRKYFSKEFKKQFGKAPNEFLQSNIRK
ncbi:response regulator [Mucilaginibacter sp. SMC90]|uniref:hybrid sensor histidine kinase/response regulator transcription factor n=1 Tax=Mucilaginibacter sp. SMC90 TaxID=2929803 RepID=UPI001FB3279D|nr:hybrid sensor histidine kinase/response regulator transcription factor [Mucilaginibacter sp. SMC90]UOE47247.1 response regulator [Mucilaginibacter sp. SMC90]